jgi:hypothetical protein
MRLDVCVLAVMTAAATLTQGRIAQAQVPGGAFARTTIAVPQDVGVGVSVAVGTDGLPLVAYYDSASNDLKVAHCADPACSHASITTVDAGPHAGFLVTVVIGTDGLGLMSYGADDGGVAFLKVAHCNDVPCSSASTASLDIVRTVGSLALGVDGLGLISYADPAGHLKVAHCLNTACSSAEVATVDATFLAADWTAMTIGADGLGLISYTSDRAAPETNHPLKIAHCSNLACSSASTGVLDTGRFATPSIALGSDGRGVIAYADYTDNRQNLKVAHCADLACSSADTTTLIASAGGLQSVAIGMDGLPIIAYTESMDGAGRVRVAHCSDASCMAATSTAVGPWTGLFGGVSLTIGADGRGFMAWQDDDGVNVAHQAHRGDFGLDGRPDLVWRRDGTGENLVWSMNGADLLSASFTNPAALGDANWRMVGTNDFNHDARTDLLWRHTTSGENVIWLMNGVSLMSGTFTATLADTRWQVGGTGDFNHDGRPDILWRHGFSGENVVWYMNGTALASGAFLGAPPLSDVNWRMAGTGDFNRNGRPDIVWHHQVSGEVVLWYMNGPILTGGTFTDPPALPDTRWRIAVVGDYNSDASPDLVWHNTFSGQAVVWFMNGARLVNGTFTNPSTFPDTNWKLVGPR